MLDQVLVLDAQERAIAVLSNDLPAACPIEDLRNRLEALAGGGYADTCLVTVPATHPDAEHAADGNYLLYQDEDGYWQEYKLMTPQRIDGEQSLIIAGGEHAFYELIGEWIDDIRPTNTTAAAALTQALAGTRWQVGYVEDLGAASARIYKTSVLAGVNTIAEKWGGELRFRLEVIGGQIYGRHVDLLARRGADTGKRFEFGKDLVGIKQTIDRTGLYTALVGRGKGVEVSGGEGSEDPAYGRRLEFADVSWSIAAGDPADKPAGLNWIGDDDAAAAYGPDGRHIVGKVEFGDCTDPEELLHLTWEALQEKKQPRVTYSMDVLVLEDLAGYEHEAVRLGDTVNVINTSVAPAITGQARVIVVDRNLMDGRDCKVTIGNYTPTVIDSLDELTTQQQSMQDRAGVWDRAGVFSPNPTGGGGLQYLIDLLQVQLASTVSGFSTDANGNLIFEDPAHTKALKLGAGIFAIANTKVGGEYVWRTFGTGDGFTANEIDVGTLRAGIVFAGQLLAAYGTITNLTAGDPEHAHMDLGVDSHGDPFVDIFDDDNALQRSIRKDGDYYGNGVVQRTYTIGTRTGIGIFIQ